MGEKVHQPLQRPLSRCGGKPFLNCMRHRGLQAPAPLPTPMASDSAEPPLRAYVVLPLQSPACAYLYSHGNTTAGQATGLKDLTTTPRQVMRPKENKGYGPGAENNLIHS